MLVDMVIMSNDSVLPSGLMLTIRNASSIYSCNWTAYGKTVLVQGDDYQASK